MAFGLRKALYGEESKASNAQRVADLEADTAELQKQVHKPHQSIGAMDGSHRGLGGGMEDEMRGH